MSTRSYIGILDNNTVKYVYCHWDGYPEYNGIILDKYYNNLNDAIQLVNGGDMSSLGTSLEKTSYYNEDKPIVETVENFLNGNHSSIEWIYLFDTELNDWIVCETSFKKFTMDDFDTLKEILAPIPESQKSNF